MDLVCGDGLGVAVLSEDLLNLPPVNPKDIITVTGQLGGAVYSPYDLYGIAAALAQWYNAPPDPFFGGNPGYAPGGGPPPPEPEAEPDELPEVVVEAPIRPPPPSPPPPPPPLPPPVESFVGPPPVVIPEVIPEVVVTSRAPTPSLGAPAGTPNVRSIGVLGLLA